MYAKHIPQYLAHKEGWINARNYGRSRLGGLPETARPSSQGSHGRDRRPRAPPTISLPNARSMGAFAPGLSPSSQLPRKAGVHISPSAPLLGPRDVTLVAQRDRRKPEAPAQALLGGRGTPGRKHVDRVPRAGLRRRCAGAGTTAMPSGRGRLPASRVPARLPRARRVGRGKRPRGLRVVELTPSQTAVPGCGRKDDLLLTATRPQRRWAVTLPPCHVTRRSRRPLAGGGTWAAAWERPGARTRQHRRGAGAL